MPSSKGKPQPDYDDAFKARAVARLYAEGYPKFGGALRKVSKDLGIPHQTLSRWAKGVGTVVDSKLVAQSVTSMEVMIEKHLEDILAEMNLKVGGAHFRELAIGFGVLFDKLQLLRGAPTSRTERLTSDSMSTKSDEELRKVIEDADRIKREALERVGLETRDGGSGDGPASTSSPAHP